MGQGTGPTIGAPLVPVTLAFLSGILLGTSAQLPPVWLLVVGGVSAGLAGWRGRQARRSIIALLVLWVCLGALRMSVWLAHPEQALAARLGDAPREVRLHGVVVDDPTGPFEPEDPEPQVCVIRLRHVRVGTRWAPIAGRVRAAVERL